MEIVLADVAPQPDVVAGAGIVIGLGCLVLAAAIVVLIVWLVRRAKNKQR